jgi:50S ribosomal subunit-associated GTPase HflX
MEEIFGSDCAVLVLDLADSVDSIIEKFRTSLKILIPHIEKTRIIIALNKIDKLSVEDLQKKINLIEDSLFGYTFYLISARDRVGIDNLVKGILGKIGILHRVELILPFDESGQEIYKWAAQRLIIIGAEWSKTIRLTLQVTEEEAEAITGRICSLPSARLLRADDQSI